MGVKDMRCEALGLIEFIVVIAIVAVLSASVWISFSFLGGRRLEAEGRKIIADISWARQMAVSTHVHQAINFDPANREYTLYRSPSGTPADFTNTNFLKRVMVDVSLSLLETSLWIYSPKGNTSGPDTITLNTDGKITQIRISSDTGSARRE